MKKPESARSLAEDLLARVAYDWVSAAEVIDLSRRSGLVDPEQLRDLSIGLVVRLVLQGLVMPGDVARDGHSSWNCSPAEAVVRIIEDWSDRSDPFVMPGELFWLDATEAGQRFGEAILRREK